MGTEICLDQSPNISVSLLLIVSPSPYLLQIPSPFTPSNGC